MSTTPTTPTSTTRIWDDAARGWDAGYEWYARNVRPLADWFCRSVASPGARVLDLASGTGQPALAIAERLRPGGRMVATDFSPGMVAALEQRRRQAGLDHVEVLEMDAQELRFEDGAFDAVSCSCGIMFCPDPVKAVGEIRRVLVPGGRFAIAVWDEPSRNPFFTISGRALATVLPPTPTDPDAPGPFRLGAPGALERMLRAGGVSDFQVERLSLTFEVESVDEYWQIFVQFAAGVADRIAALPERDRARVREALRQGAGPFVQDGRLRLPASALCASGRVP